MNRKFALLLLAAVLLLSGCAARTVDKMYCVPKRPEEFRALQSAIDREMANLTYCAPLSGENQQTVQMADLDGDGANEYLIFAKGTGERPLEILVFHRSGDDYALIQTLQGSGTAFDQVEYVQMDGMPGVELVVGCQLSDQVLRSVSVYSFADGLGTQLSTASYTRFLACDMDSDGYGELMVFGPGPEEAVNGEVKLFRFSGGSAETYGTAQLSAPAERLKRIISGKLQGGFSGVFATSVTEEGTLLTDVCTLWGGDFVNLSLSRETGFQVPVGEALYASDIDGDGTVELPEVETMRVPKGQTAPERVHLIRWYALHPSGSSVSKCYTCHNFRDGWFLNLDTALAMRLAVVEEDSGGCAFWAWDSTRAKAEKLLTVYALTGDNREEEAVQDNRFVLQQTETTVYAARLEAASAAWELSADAVTQAFHLIRMDWKTGET